MKNHQELQDFIHIDQYVKLQQDFAEKEQKFEERLWLDTSVSQFDNVLRLNYNKSTSDFSKIVLDYAAELTKAYIGVFYICNQETQITQVVAGYACVIDKLSQQTYEVGEGIVGQAIESKKIIFFENLPAQNIEIKSSTLNIGAASILIVPLVFNDKAFGVIELVFLRNLESKFQQLLEVVSRNVAAMLESITNNERTKELLKQSQEQTESLRSQEEELRQNMEELQSIQEEVTRKQEEIAKLLQRFNLASETTTEGLWDMIVPKDLSIQDDTTFWWADRFRKMLGYENEIDFPNRLDSWSNLLHPNHKEKTLRAFHHHLFDYTGATPYDVEYQLKLKDGSYKWFRAVGNTLRDNEGIPVRVAGTLIDIQVIKDLQEAKGYEKLLAESQQQAEALQAQEEELRQNMEELQTTQDQMIKNQAELEEARAKTELIKQEEAERAAKVAEMQKKAMLSTTQKLKNKLDELQKVKEEMEKIKENEAKRAIRVAEMQKQAINKVILRLRNTDAELNELKKVTPHL
jgi:PAS domain-containing protein